MKISKEKRDEVFRAARKLDSQINRVRDLKLAVESANEAADEAFDNMIEVLRGAGLDVRTYSEDHVEGYEFSINNVGHYSNDEFESELRGALGNDEEDEEDEEDDSHDPFPVHGDDVPWVTDDDGPYIFSDDKEA